MAAIAELGPSPIHRKTFRGVKEHLPPVSEEARAAVSGLFLLPGL